MIAMTAAVRPKSLFLPCFTTLGFFLFLSLLAPAGNACAITPVEFRLVPQNPQ
jgi:hypothetical protein